MNILVIILALMTGTAAADVDDSAAFQVGISYLDEHALEWGIRDAGEEFQLNQVIRDETGYFHVRVDQVYNGIHVLGKQLVVHMNNNGEPYSATGAYLAGITASANPKLTGLEALEKARKHFPGKWKHDDSLVLYQKGAEVILVHRVELENDEGPKRIVALIDAATGELVMSYDDLKSSKPGQGSPEIGTGNSLYSGTVSITTGRDDAGLFSMLDAIRGGLQTRDLKDKSGGKGVILTDADNIWGDFTRYDRATAGVDAHFGAEMTWDYYLNVHGRNGIFNDGKGTVSRVHFRSNYSNAFWRDSCKCVTYGDGDGILFSPLVSIEIAGHEMTHGVTAATADLIYRDESGGLNEAMSDIFGTMIEYYASTHGAVKDPNYLIGEDVFTPGTPGDALRYMDNPTMDGRSIDTYANYSDGINVHYSSGIANNAFYLLAEGGTHRLGGTVAGIGREKAEKIFYLALTGYMINDETFSQARADTIRAATQLYGAGGEEVASLEQAWSAVGVV